MSNNFQTLVELLRERASARGATRAITFLEDGEQAERTITYGALDRRARAIAGELERQGARGKHALLLFPPGLEYIAAFFGCLYAGVVAVPVYPPDVARLARTLGRLQSIAQDADAKLALTTGTLLGMASSMGELAPFLAQLQWIACDAVPDAVADSWQPPRIDADTLAFLQYTSGSTGDPKGVMLTHRNLLHNQRMIATGFRHDEKSLVVGWLPLYHDMGLIGNLLQPLYGGFPVVLMSPLDFLARPMRWLRAVSRYRATTSGGPNFAYELCVRKSTPAERAALDLSWWKVAFSGAEPVRADTLDRFAEAFAVSGFRRDRFYPCYGLAESSLMVSGAREGREPVTTRLDPAALEQRRVVAKGDGTTFVSNGGALLDEKLRIVDPETGTVVGDDAIGEIWAQSPSVALGYWRRPELTEQVFGARLPGEEGTFLRTGDLGFLRDGELFITGRAKDLIILRGRNIYPQDLERTIERVDPLLRPGCGAAFSIDHMGEERLVIVHELDRSAPPELDPLLDRIQSALSQEHAVSAHAIVLIEAGSIHKTSSGKIQRSATRAAFIAGALQRRAERVR